VKIRLRHNAFQCSPGRFRDALFLAESPGRYDGEVSPPLRVSAEPR
jgi:hypothetical protein